MKSPIEVEELEKRDLAIQEGKLIALEARKEKYFPPCDSLIRQSEKLIKMNQNKLIILL